MGEGVQAALITFMWIRNVANWRPTSSPIQLLMRLMKGLQPRVSTEHPILKTDTRHRQTTIREVNEAAIRRGQLFHVIVTYGYLPKQIAGGEGGSAAV